MSTIAPTITGVSLLHGNARGQGSLKTYLVTCSVPAYTNSDTITISDVGATIETFNKKGKTNTLTGAICVEPGVDTAGTAVYLTGTAAWAMTVSSDTLTGHLAVAAGTEIASATASKGCTLAVVVSEA
jgi:hypothetical protein